MRYRYQIFYVVKKTDLNNLKIGEVLTLITILRRKYVVSCLKEEMIVFLKKVNSISLWMYLSFMIVVQTHPKQYSS